ncbi:MAG: tRNA 4-thiouridine(8) synthase ThiI [Planctomycetes bacterium]|nr:tRNA 4-thiouridine(8) synthase ThiI [Planctomycetota bacterium]
MSAIFLLRYDEIALKGRNRSHFEQALVKHLRWALYGSRPKISRIRGRILLEVEPGQEGSAREVIARIPGISNFSEGSRCGSDLETLKEKTLESFGQFWNRSDPVRFRISANRSDKTYPLKSTELNVALGSAVIGHFGGEKIHVSLNEPDFDIGIEIHKSGAFIYNGRTPGTGGLPVGTAGRVLCLLSGGIDSPVAAWRMMRRGCEVDYVFFENRPFLGRAAALKVMRLAELLARFQFRARLFIVPFADIQVAIRDLCQEKHRVVLYRRFMMRIANRILERGQHLGLVTGESLGQVASQTLENMAATDILAAAPVYRPLVAMDKLDIIKFARQIGSFDISIESAPDCCAVFMPQKPATRAKIEWLEEDEKKLDTEGLITAALDAVETIEVPVRNRATPSPETAPSPEPTTPD